MKIWDEDEIRGEGEEDWAPTSPADESLLPSESGDTDVVFQSPEHRALHLYARTGSLAKVSRTLGIPLYELQKLSRSEWWITELQLLQREEAAISNVTMTKILNSTFRQLEDRIENGDYVLMGGRLKRKPVDASALAKIAGVIFDKRQLVRGLPTNIDGANDKLKQLADRLRALGLRDPSLIDITDLTPEDEADGPEAA